ncbi:hypothetical protein GCM10007963_16480 [Lutibacter litoralis]|nr:hypothetical protein GCM10007963_16480 [Lutibacter litoralis]
MFFISIFSLSEANEAIKINSIKMTPKAINVPKMEATKFLKNFMSALYYIKIT